MGDTKKVSNTSSHNYHDYYLHLNYSYFDNPKALYKTLSKYPSPDLFYAHYKKDLIQKQTTKTKDYLLKKYHDFNADEQRNLMTEKKIQYCVITDPDYPELLKEIPYPPPILFYKGDISVLNTPCLAIVGPRKASAYVN